MTQPQGNQPPSSDPVIVLSQSILALVSDLKQGVEKVSDQVANIVTDVRDMSKDLKQVVIQTDKMLLTLYGEDDKKGLVERVRNLEEFKANALKVGAVLGTMLISSLSVIFYFLWQIGTGQVKVVFP